MHRVLSRRPTMHRPFANLCLATLATLAAADAHAVHLDPHGMGQVLIYPYYTVNAGHATLLSVVNTTDQVKAVKLRLREAVKGQSVLDFNLYLASFDVYTAALVADGVDAPARLISSDTSCTVPAGVMTGAISTHEIRYAGPDDGPPGLERTREGWIELIEMGVVEDWSFASAATHNGGRPPGCDRLIAAWNGGVWSINPTQAATGTAVGVSPPRGGLYGGAVILDVAQGIAFTYAADAIDGFYGLSETQLHTPPGSATPNLASAETSPGQARARIYAEGRAVELDFVAGRPDAVSAVLMAEAFFNEYSIAPAVDAASDWVVTFPTRHLHEQQVDAARRRPFATTNQGCEEFRIYFFDRESGPDAPPPAIDMGLGRRGIGFCYQTQVLAWGAQVTRTGPTRLLGSQLVPDFGDYEHLLHQPNQEPALAGHVMTEFYPRFLLDGVENAGQASRHQVYGLPVTGFWVVNYVNAQAQPGLLANYSTATRHRTRAQVRSVLVSGEGTPGESITPAAGQ